MIFKEKIFWRQKARVQWLKQGDNNTRFFNNLANGRKYKKLISSLTIDGSFTDDPNLIESALINFYESLYTKDSKRVGIGNQ